MYLLLFSLIVCFSFYVGITYHAVFVIGKETVNHFQVQKKRMKILLNFSVFHTRSNHNTISGPYSSALQNIANSAEIHGLIVNSSASFELNFHNHIVFLGLFHFPILHPSSHRSLPEHGHTISCDGSYLGSPTGSNCSRGSFFYSDGQKTLIFRSSSVAAPSATLSYFYARAHG